MPKRNEFTEVELTLLDNETMDTAQAAYDEAMDIAWAAYDEAMDIAWAAFDKVHVTAWTAYAKVLVPALDAGLDWMNEENAKA